MFILWSLKIFSKTSETFPPVNLFQKVLIKLYCVLCIVLCATRDITDMKVTVFVFKDFTVLELKSLRQQQVIKMIQYKML